ncbi:MAG: mechanosensitive ion channel family protein [Deltaproteobacteria bacterium]
MDWLEIVYLGNSARAWLAAALGGALCLVALEVVKGQAVKRLSLLARRTESGVDDVLVAMLGATRLVAIIAVSVYVATLLVELPTPAQRLVGMALTLILTFQVAVWGNVLISTWLARRFGPPATAGDQSGEDSGAMDTVVGTGYGALGFLARLALWSVLLLMALDNLGIEVRTLVAGLGVGGIAIALAVQSILGDVFCSLSIILDKPFEIGDFIIVGEQRGTVEHIGIKTTRLLSLRGEQIVFANSDLVNSRIQNFKRMDERRILTSFGVTYQTTSDKLESIPGLVTGVLERVDMARLDRIHFQSYGDSSLVFELVYYVGSSDYADYMNVQQEINLELFRTFEREKIEFAYPTQTLYLRQST